MSQPDPATVIPARRLHDGTTSTSPALPAAAGVALLSLLMGLSALGMPHALVGGLGLLCALTMAPMLHRYLDD